MTNDHPGHHGSETGHAGQVEVAHGGVPADPGAKPHKPRLTDVDERAARRAERQVAAMFGLATLAVLASCVLFFVFTLDGLGHDRLRSVRANNFAVGGTLGLALVAIGAGAVQWAKKLMSDVEIVQERHVMKSEPATTDAAVEAFETGTEESGFGRRTLIRNSLIGALAVLPLPAIVYLRDLGQLPGNVKAHTIWAEGVRIVRDVSFEPIRLADVQLGQLVNCMPENFEDLPEEGHDRQVAKSKAPVIVVRMDPDDVRPADGREDWHVEGVVCYSKICSHAGCPISLYEQNTHHVLCPCHQSTFDLAENGKVVFGPAARNLPQLPIAVDDEGYLIAQSDFTEPVGPSYWERG